jgi:hypothetical protein
LGQIRTTYSVVEEGPRFTCSCSTAQRSHQRTLNDHSQELSDAHCHIALIRCGSLRWGFQRPARLKSTLHIHLFVQCHRAVVKVNAAITGSEVSVLRPFLSRYSISDHDCPTSFSGSTRMYYQTDF